MENIVPSWQAIFLLTSDSSNLIPGTRWGWLEFCSVFSVTYLNDSIRTEGINLGILESLCSVPFEFCTCGEKMYLGNVGKSCLTGDFNSFSGCFWCRIFPSPFSLKMFCILFVRTFEKYYFVTLWLLGILLKSPEAGARNQVWCLQKQI